MWFAVKYIRKISEFEISIVLNCNLGMKTDGERATKK